MGLRKASGWTWLEAQRQGRALELRWSHSDRVEVITPASTRCFSESHKNVPNRQLKMVRTRQLVAIDYWSKAINDIPECHAVPVQLIKNFNKESLGEFEFTRMLLHNLPHAVDELQEHRRAL
jgi:hypothetical protein